MKLIGLDVGSTTVKAVVVDAASDAVLWQDYQRHETRQAGKALDILQAIEAAFPDTPRDQWRLFATGSGGAALLPHTGGRFVQEVNAVALAVEKFHPEVESVVELGGQDAKIIVFKPQEDGVKKKIPSMNDKCAGGTGAVIDKIAAKLRIPAGHLGEMGYDGLALHPVAGKCGVFAETDINSLQKQGVPVEELMASLFEAIVGQNLSVLTRGHTLRPTVLLLGGPNTFIRGLRECWRHNLPLVWAERGIVLPDPARPAADYIITPDNAQYFAALGAVAFGRLAMEETPEVGAYRGWEALAESIAHGGGARAGGLPGLSGDAEDLAAFLERYRRPPWEAPRLAPGTLVQAFLGIDGGSTSTKAVLLDQEGKVLAKAYQLSRGNPIEDSKDVIATLSRQVTEQGARLEVLGVGTTGYAKDVLQEVLKADVALVETVAHTEACLHFYRDADVVVDVGGQDIKLIALKDGRVKDFKLNTQCSAGNGYFLQATAQTFGFDVREFADIAFSARAMPSFGYGCAVFMQSDIVDFQRQGWRPEEIMAGLAAVLPKNIWLYVAQMPNLARLGRRFVLQGGTQYNLAAVKAQVDFITARFHGTGTTPEVIVHPHCGETGAIGSALEARRLWAHQGRRTDFIGIERVAMIRYQSTIGEQTRCHFCKNECLRNFIDVHTGETTSEEGQAFETTVPLLPGHRRLIVATCEKGTVESVAVMRGIKTARDHVAKENANIVELASRWAFREPKSVTASTGITVSAGSTGSAGSAGASRAGLPGLLDRLRPRRRARPAGREAIRIGFPRVLNLYSQAPFFIAYFMALGIPHRNLVFSDYTDQALYKRGARRGSIDPCFPSKLGIPHVHDLLHRVHPKKRLTHIFFPMVDSFPSFLDGVLASKTCPTVVATAEATHAAFIKEGDAFRERGIVFKKTFLNLDDPLLCARQMQEDWGGDLGLGFKESLHAVQQGLAALEAHEAELRRRSREALDRLEREQRIGVVVLGRPYHNDPGINHGILDEIQQAGYPVFWQDTLPRDADILERLFGEERRAGDIRSALDIGDVWKNSYSENSSRKLWAAKYAARHPNLVALELSSFKCGHDAPIYTAIEEIIESSGTPYFAFKDIDENQPAGSIKIRIETIAYALGRYREQMFTLRGE